MRNCLGLFVVVFSAQLAFAASTAYRVLPTSELKFRVRNFGITSVEGKFKDFSGTLQLDQTFENSKATAEIMTASLDSENEERDTHLKSSDFFDVKTHPKISFKSTAIKGTKDSFELTGELEIKKIPKSITLKCVDAKLERAEVSFRCEGETDRTLFGITHGGTIGDKVKLELLIAAAL